MLNNDQVEALKRHALEGDGEACMQLARIFDKAGQHDVALQWLGEAIANGHTPSMTALGARLLAGRAAPQNYQRGAMLIAEAANRNHPEACAVQAMLAACGLGQQENFGEAADFLVKAAELDAPRAREQLAVFVSDPLVRSQLIHGEIGGGIPWQAVRAQLDFAGFLRTPAPEVVSTAPAITAIRGFISPAACRYLIERARPRLSAARVNDPEIGGARAHDIRTNTGVGFAFMETDVVLQLVAQKIAAAVDLPISFQESTNILHYAPGQQYAPHFDFLDVANPVFASQLATLGQRVATCLVYLNDDYDGGETSFPALHWRFKGAPGDALIFRNVDAQGAPDQRTLHAGLAPTRGEKWLLSKWIRDRAQPIV